MSYVIVDPASPGTRKLRKKMAKVAVPVPQNPWTGQPMLADGMHEVYRAKLRSPVGSHYGVLVSFGGMVTAYDLQAGEGPREVTYAKFAEGHRVYVTKYIPFGPEYAAASDRMRRAWIENAVWTLFQNNCEHWAKYVVRGEHKSGQIESLLILGAIGLLIYFARSA